MTKDNIAISVNGVHKHFKLPHERHTTVKSKLINGITGRVGYSTQKALDGISFDVKKGEFFGIVGRNGSGKSTLLKCMAGVYNPTKGHIDINGSLVPFIELGVGFNPELSGRDNVFLNGALLGFSDKEMEALYPDIVEFAELEEFMDQKLKNYSSGMQVRLAFSIAIRAKGDILLLDEVLAVGDTSFQKKCNDYFYKLKDNKQTVILVTHSMGAVEQFCDRAMLIESGRIMSVGAPNDIADSYNEMNLATSRESLSRQNSKLVDSLEHDKDRDAYITKVETFDPATKKHLDTFTYKQKIGIRYFVYANRFIESPTFGLTLKDRKDIQIFATNTPSLGINTENIDSGQKIMIEFEIDNIFANGDYYVSAGIASKDRTEVYFRGYNIHQFEIGGWKFPESLSHPNHKITIDYKVKSS